MRDIPSFPYGNLRQERTITFVANLTRQDGIGFLQLAPQVPVRTETPRFELSYTNEALPCFREGRLDGAVVPVP